MRLVGTTVIVRPIVEAELARLERIYAGTPLYFEALGIAEPTIEDVRAQYEAAQATPGRMLLGIEVPAVDLLI
ncbi:MAG: GNAT family N-acetyltransferase, partial [Anaerolineales bacterium]|nr:GNAT family N-acetyltransferase [Anaerolineales bacterium]